MSEQKHTPGPWRLNDPIHAHVLADDYHAVDGGCGFYKTEGRYRESGFGVMAHMSLADARLISAAPELLDEAVGASGLLQALFAHLAPVLSDKVRADIKARVLTLNAAIAKATGAHQ